MARVRPWVLVVLGVVVLAACGSAGATKAEEPPPSKVVKVANSNVRRIVLTSGAVERLGLETAPITTGSDGGAVAPYAAVIYSPSGRTWVYEQVGPRAYQRSAVTVDRIEGSDAHLTAGPPAGTQVVTVAAAEVYGTEFFSDHE
jgi:hypothetical protein